MTRLFGSREIALGQPRCSPRAPPARNLVVAGIAVDAADAVAALPRVPGPVGQPAHAVAARRRGRWSRSARASRAAQRRLWPSGSAGHGTPRAR